MTPAERAPSPMDADLVAARRVLRLETRGWQSGHPRPAVVGFVEDPDGSLVVAAQEPDAAWALNLLADRRCTVALGAERFLADAEPLAGADHAAAVGALILRYGTPSERLGRGPSFRLRPIARNGDEAS